MCVVGEHVSVYMVGEVACIRARENWNGASSSEQHRPLWLSP